MDKPVVATTCQIWKPVERLEAKKTKPAKATLQPFFTLDAVSDEALVSLGAFSFVLALHPFQGCC